VTVFKLLFLIKKNENIFNSLIIHNFEIHEIYGVWYDVRFSIVDNMFLEASRNFMVLKTKFIIYFYE